MSGGEADRTLRYRLALAVAALVALLASAVSLAVGPTGVDGGSLLSALCAYDPLDEAQFVVHEIRLPRVLLALLVGGSLAAAGAAMQGVTRNPLAGPSIMGLSGGGSLAVLIAMIALPGLSYNAAVAASFVGAGLGFGCVLAVARLSPDGFSPTRLTLAGVVVSALLAAVTQGLLIAYGMQGDALYWTVGGIANVSWPQVQAVAPVCLLGLLGVMLMAPEITILGLGDDTAVGLGQRPRLAKIGVAFSVLLLAGAAVAAAGPVGFIGLMVPHVCRTMVGVDYRRLIPMSAVAGAGLTALADLGSRTIFGMGGEIPLGVLTAVLGAPFFVWLIRSGGKERLDRGAPAAPVGRSHPPVRRMLPLLAGALLLAVAGAIAFGGHAALSPGTLIMALCGAGDDSDAQLLLWSFRLPRIAFALLVGAGIAVSGVVIQGVFRNDLAEPGLLGVSAGAGLGIVLALGVLGHGVLASVYTLPIAAVGGALVAIALVCALSLGTARSSPRLLLTGVAVSAALGALTLFISMQISSEAYAFAVAFSAGSLGAADWNYVLVLALWLGLLVPLAWSFAPVLDVMRLGESSATGLGVHVPVAVFVLLALAVALCAACIALAGGLLFLGLIAPHVARRLVGSGSSAVLPAAGLVGATLLVLADALAGRLVPTSEIPAGVMVTALGAPYFLYLLRRR